MDGFTVKERSEFLTGSERGDDTDTSRRVLGEEGTPPPAARRRIETVTPNAGE